MSAKRPVVGTRILDGEEVRYASAADAARDGFNANAICACCKGKTHSHKGYTWAYGAAEAPKKDLEEEDPFQPAAASGSKRLSCGRLDCFANRGGSCGVLNTAPAACGFYKTVRRALEDSIASYERVLRNSDEDVIMLYYGSRERLAAILERTKVKLKGLR